LILAMMFYIDHVGVSTQLLDLCHAPILFMLKDDLCSHAG
jgi:hypothetical protein